jgi:hypothetical protein
MVLQNKSDNSNGHTLLYSLFATPDGASKQIGQLYCPCTSKLLNPDGAAKQIGQQ